MYRSDNEIRRAVKTIFGAKNARVARNGEVHVRGRLPNTGKFGWYLLGITGQQELENLIFWEDGSLVENVH